MRDFSPAVWDAGDGVSTILLKINGIKQFPTVSFQNKVDFLLLHYYCLGFTLHMTLLFNFINYGLAPQPLCLEQSELT